MALALIIFDCDGVLLESVDAKTRAFARIGAAFGPEAERRLVRYHEQHGGVSRYKKFEWLYTEVLGREISPEESARLGALFEEYSLDEVNRCPLVPGVQEVLDAWSGRVPLYVASGAPHEELVRVLESRGLAGRFAGIYGSPPGKAELLRNILRESGVHPADAVMIGDSSTDQYAAEAVLTRFYGRGEYFRHSGYPWHTDLTHLNVHLEDLFREGKE